jgi:hypothetical protein
MTVLIARRGPDGQLIKVPMDDTRVKAIPARPLPRLKNPDQVFEGNTLFVNLDPNKYFKRKRG